MSAKTTRMHVSYSVTKYRMLTGDAEMDVPDEVIFGDGSIDVDWVRCNFPDDELALSDEDIIDSRHGFADEEASATVVVKEGGA